MARNYLQRKGGSPNAPPRLTQTRKWGCWGKMTRLLEGAIGQRRKNFTTARAFEQGNQKKS